MDWIDEMQMETPEQIEVDLELAGLGSRFMAQFIDWLWKIIISFVLFFLTIIVLGLLGKAQVFDKPSTLGIALIVVVLYLLWLGYGVFFEVRWSGQTPGKRFAGIRVIREGGAPLDFQTAGIRNLLAMADFIPVFFLLGALLILLTSKRQRLGDMAAGTIVIRERKVDLGTEVEDALYDYASEEYSFATSQLNKLTPADRTILREFLRRNDDMNYSERSRLACKLANTYLDKTRYALDEDFTSGSDAREFLASLLRDLEQFLKHN